MAPAVRTSFGEKQIINSLKQLGCKYVFDTTFAADLTTMEEASELLDRLATHSDPKYPMFTSCCPAWVRFAELFTPQLVPHISTTKSPIMMQGATIKTYFAEKNKIDPRKIFNVALTPCTAKKAEIKRPDSNTLTNQPNGEGLAEVDLVLTVREFGNLLTEQKIALTKNANAQFDSMQGSGSGLSFGMTGGVMESALRTAYYLMHKKNAPLQKEAEIRGEKLTVNWVNPMPFAGRIAGIREDKIDFGDRQLRIAVVETPSSLRGLLDAIENDGERFDFVEVMSCRGGCLGGGGQPYPEEDDWMELVYDRRDALQSGIAQNKVRFCHENAEVQAVYREYFGEPMSDKAKLLLHCKQ
jgi:ferredoxin hydrogenase